MRKFWKKLRKFRRKFRKLENVKKFSENIKKLGRKFSKISNKFIRKCAEVLMKIWRNLEESFRKLCRKFDSRKEWSRILFAMMFWKWLRIVFSQRYVCRNSYCSKSTFEYILQKTVFFAPPADFTRAMLMVGQKTVL